jgi:hypothetical protein
LYYGPAKDTVKQIMTMFEEIHIEQRDNNDKFWAMYTQNTKRQPFKEKKNLIKWLEKFINILLMEESLIAQK